MTGFQRSYETITSAYNTIALGGRVIGEWFRAPDTGNWRRRPDIVMTDEVRATYRAGGKPR